MESTSARLGDSAQNSIKPMPELGRLKAAAERVAHQASCVESFIIRFHGSLPGSDEGSESDKPVESYRNDLSSLFAQIERLETAVANLDSIG
jgi:hypothetical protein